MKRATIRKRGGYWVLTWTPYGFGRVRIDFCDTFIEAVHMLDGARRTEQRRYHGQPLPGTGMLSTCEMSSTPLGEILMRRQHEAAT